MSNRSVVLAGNPNVGKSTVFNELTGMHQHTGNWIGKTVDIKSAQFYYKYNDYTVVDLPGTYSLSSASKEEEIASDFIKKQNADCVVCVVDTALLERSLVLVFQIMKMTDRVIVLLNLTDEAEKRGISVDSVMLSELLGVPVVKSTARSGRGINALLEQIHLITTGAVKPQAKIDFSRDYYSQAKEIANSALTSAMEEKISLLDKIMLGKYTSFIAIALVFASVLWITISLANYPSDLLKSAFDSFEVFLAERLALAGISETVIDVAVHGVLRVLFWVVSVMLPPMAIFFPLFALLEDFGLFPRIAFNFDYCFQRCGACGKQSLTCCMGLGCNAVGVTGARIIDSPRERLIAIVTNSLTPCNGRFPILLAIISAFFSRSSAAAAFIMLALLGLSLSVTMACSKLLSKTILKGVPSSFVMELPPYRRPQFFKTVALSVKEKVLSVLLRAVVAAAPAGAVIWALSNISINGSSLLFHMSQALNPIGLALGMDGVILLAFLLGFPANEIVIPIALMAYLSEGVLGDNYTASSLSQVFVENGWTVKTALCTCVFTLFHFPCATTLITVFKETKSAKWTLLSVLTPLFTGVSLCFIINLVFSFV